MDKSEYEGNIKEFSADMHLIFTNAMSYNQKGSDIYAWAKELNDLLKKEMTTVFGDALTDANRSRAQPAIARKVSESNMSANTPISVDDDEDDAAARGKGQSNRNRSRKSEADDEEDEGAAGRNRSRRSGAGTHSGRDSRKRRRDDD
eukprot:CAMPEP_0184324074 /NCGR_PEP_ID=MMETSP1049-20130417/133459_1 /TAXON_ID=77928 /ORGANISM="Proteomonas sulcata, Strain CCMP704" /LENGTH=146 /DNA_ID=CAMNT_0026645753 /DNA_START=6 /DNA_END=446 /DNA_ORIENTATION=-